jgi:hypothetical protein
VDGAAAPATEQQPVTSAIATLIFEGGLDPITPVEYGAMAARTLSHSYEAIFLYATHGVQLPNDCAVFIARTFLDQPGSRPDMFWSSGVSQSPGTVQPCTAAASFSA